MLVAMKLGTHYVYTKLKIDYVFKNSCYEVLTTPVLVS
jgi:hypothetical protein